MRNYGRNTAYAMVVIVAAMVLYTACKWIMCNAGFGGCQ